MSSCPICNIKSIETDLHHRICDRKIHTCPGCEYYYVDCNGFSQSDIFNHQDSNSMYFGKNFKRNEEYCEIIGDLINAHGFKDILEIGTPFNYDLLRRLHENHGDVINISSYDIIEFSHPEYITLYTNISDILNKNFDLIVCLHTLEHIPSDEIIDFVNLCKNIGTYQIFEVPKISDLEMVSESQMHPHYSYFTEKTLSILFGTEYNIQSRSNDRLLVIDNLKNKITFKNENN